MSYQKAKPSLCDTQDLKTDLYFSQALNFNFSGPSWDKYFFQSYDWYTDLLAKYVLAK